jgi:hypothetical protein
MMPIVPYFHWMNCWLSSTKRAERRAMAGMVAHLSGDHEGGTGRNEPCAWDDYLRVTCEWNQIFRQLFQVGDQLQ